MHGFEPRRYPNSTLYGESALLMRFGEGIDLRLHAQIQAFCTAVTELSIPGVVELVPAYDCVNVVFNPALQSPRDLQAMLDAIAVQVTDAKYVRKRVVEIPVCYGGEAGPDLPFVASHTGLSADAVIKLHTQPDYTVFMIGFVPGFPYLGGMDERIAAPRKLTPRAKIPAGSVGIAGAQTGVYPLETPGGWQLIGRTPLRLFDPDATPPALLYAGDTVRFRAISVGEFAAWVGELE